jgi:hypothetical protein
MDLDSLKTSWQKETEDYTQLNQKDMEQLHLILKEKTAGVMINVKKKYETIISMVMMGMFLNILISPFLHWLLGDPGPVFRMPSLLSLLTIITACLVILIFYRIKYISLKTTVAVDDLKLALTDNIDQLKRSFKYEVQFLIALFILLMIIARMQSQYRGNGDFGDIFRLDIMLSILAGCALLTFGLLRRKRQYDRNIAELQQYLNELE